MSSTVVLNLFCAVAHFLEPQNIVAQFHKSFDVLLTMSLGKAQGIMAVMLISKEMKKKSLLF